MNLSHNFTFLHTWMRFNCVPVTPTRSRVALLWNPCFPHPKGWPNGRFGWWGPR